MSKPLVECSSGTGAAVFLRKVLAIDIWLSSGLSTHFRSAYLKIVVLALKKVPLDEMSMAECILREVTLRRMPSLLLPACLALRGCDVQCSIIPDRFEHVSISAV